MEKTSILRDEIETGRTKEELFRVQSEIEKRQNKALRNQEKWINLPEDLEKDNELMTFEVNIPRIDLEILLRFHDLDGCADTDWLMNSLFFNELRRIRNGEE